MNRKKVESSNQIDAITDEKTTSDLADLQQYLDLYMVKYPDEYTLNNSIEQLREYVPRRKPLLQNLYTQLLEATFRIFPFYRFTSIGLFLFGSLLLPNKIY
jgi:hypothetical protein